MECEFLEKCSFVAACNEMHKENAAKGFIASFCKGPKMEQCIRKQLCLKFGKSVVPKNMMPNGAALSGTDKNDWSDEALNYRKALA
jgi:hypothetical protein